MRISRAMCLYHPNSAPARLSACVMDGVTVGHPRCNVDRCLARLVSPRDRFCAKHSDLDNQCAIADCTLPARLGSRTCSTPSHKEYESQRRERGQAFHRLEKRIQTFSAEGARHTTSTSGNIDIIDHPDVASALQALEDSGSQPACDGKSSGPHKMRSSLTRRWTHNEQLVFRCCGVIMSRATFFHAESPSNALVSSQAIVPPLLTVDTFII